MHRTGDENLIYHYEVLRARLEIRDFFMKNIVREVYENIGQVLSLVRMQLAFVDEDKKEMPVENIVSSGKLVGQSIRDLRSMCGSFYPDEDLLKEGGFIRALDDSVKIIFANNDTKIKTSSTSTELAESQQLILFKIMLDLLCAIKDSKGIYSSTIIKRQEEFVTFTLLFKGNDFNINTKTDSSHLKPPLLITERLELLGATQCKRLTRSGLSRIILRVPVKSSYHE